MAPSANNQPAFPFLVPKSDLDHDLQEFFIDREARNLTPKTLLWYRQSLGIFADYLLSQGIEATADIATALLRRFLLHLRERGHNPGGIRNIWGAAKAFLRWYEAEAAPEGWKTPLRQVKSPKTPEVQMQPVPLGDLRKMLATCGRRNPTGDRDRAILMALLDMGARAAEFVALDVGDVNLASGAVLIQEGKGRKFRTVFVGARSRRELLRYLRHRGDLGSDAPLWATRQGGRLTYARAAPGGAPTGRGRWRAHALATQLPPRLRPGLLAGRCGPGEPATDAGPCRLEYPAALPGPDRGRPACGPRQGLAGGPPAVGSPGHRAGHVAMSHSSPRMGHRRLGGVMP